MIQTKQNKTKQNKTKQNKTKQNKTKQHKTKQNKTKQNKTTFKGWQQTGFPYKEEITPQSIVVFFGENDVRILPNDATTKLSFLLKVNINNFNIYIYK
jgi:hypothetical protein